jgi:hypothetical protein
VTIRQDLARADSAQRYQIASVQSAESYRAGRVAQEAAANTAAEARAAAARAASLPVIVDGPALPQPVEPTVTIARPPAPDGKQATQVTPSQSAVVPLPQAIVAGLLATEGRHDPQGVAALQAEWGAEVGINLGYAYRYLAGHLTDEQWERAKEIPLVTVPILRLLAEMGRAEAHNTITPSTPTKGQTMPAETLTKPDAEKRFRQLTSEFHSARARGDHIRARELADERDLLAAALFPGDNRPAEGERKVI